MSTTHAYFLIDANSLGTATSVTRVVTRILVYLASHNDTCTWNFEILDLQSRPRALTAHAKRRIRERRPVTSESLHALTMAVCADVRTLGTKQAMARTLRERLMCLEADIEWGDPALMRSPTRGPTARAWMDPTRRNESMSVRSFLYIIGDFPTTPDEIDVFLGPAVDHATLLEKLSRVRDCLIGDGIWESYARKRVGVSWIRVSPRTAQSPVDEIVGSVMGCCMEALGGCMMSLRELSQPSVPFSSAFGRKHRVCTHPGWSRKFAREVSAVADYLLAGRVQGERRAWALKYEANTHVTGSKSVLVETEYGRRSWLNDARLARRYDLPELVALAAHARTTHMQHEARAAACAVELSHILDAPNHVWPLIARRITSAPTLCHAQGWLSNDQVVLAQQSNAGVVAYVAVVLVGQSMVAVYPMDASVFARVMDVVDRVQLENAGASVATAFRAAWLEDWTVWAEDLDVVPSEQCAIDVGIDPSLIDAYMTAAGSSTNVQGGKLPDEAADNIPVNMSLVALISEPTDSLASAAVPTHAPVTLDAWYADLYIKTIQQPSPEFDHAISTIQPILDNTAASSGAETAVTQLYTSVLQSSASIEDVFTSSDAQDNTEFAASRQEASNMADNLSSQRTWQLHECQLQILLHLLAIDRCRLWQLDSLIETHGLVESLNDLVDQLCIWTSVDDIFSSANGQTSGAGDLAAVFIGGPNVAQFTERLSDIVDELRVQCGWVPTADTDSAQLPNVSTENKRRKGTPRKMADASNRSEMIVQPHAHKPLMSGRKLARHLDELISKRTGFGSNNKAEKSACVGEPPAQRRKSVQLKMPLQLIRQLKSEVVSTTRPLVSRSRTMTGRSNSSGGMWQAKRSSVNSGSMRQSGQSNTNSTRQIGRSNTGNTLSAAKPRAPLQRSAIPEFADLSSSPSISGRVNDMHLVPETPSKKRQRTRDEDHASPLFIPTSMPIHAFIYESDGSEQSPLCGRTAEPLHDQSSRRVLRFPGSRGR
ncbi:hypothetical protein GGH96_002055 [Coemansia sp. RSA 1972]|nr:hypothetical protein GGH96_002055 [Coemansia sp. RSA 1972]